MMIRLSLLLFVFAFAGAAWAGPAGQAAPRPLAIGDTFPRLESEFLTGRKAVLPDAAKGKVAFILMGFTYDSRFSVEQWAERFRLDVKPGPDVTWFEIPVIGGMARMASWFINSGMRRGTPKDLHENVITVYGGVDRWKQLIGYSDTAPDDGYLAVLDREGRVQWLHHGPATDDVVAELKATIARLTGSGS
ncbi:MAG: hypothetical protein NTY02_09225 [Acidobacteria bacterium]|nr:hypothetical protein [Acidobacteriota bacterium]